MLSISITSGRNFKYKQVYRDIVKKFQFGSINITKCYVLQLCYYVSKQRATKGPRREQLPPPPYLVFCLNSLWAGAAHWSWMCAVRARDDVCWCALARSSSHVRLVFWERARACLISNERHKGMHDGRGDAGEWRLAEASSRNTPAASHYSALRLLIGYTPLA